MFRRRAVQKEGPRLQHYPITQYTTVGGGGGVYVEHEAWKRIQIQYNYDQDNDSYNFVLNTNGRGLWGNDSSYREGFYL